MSDYKEKLAVHYYQVTDLWKRICQAHTDLLDRTFDEYSCLLSSEIEELDIVQKEKALVVEYISKLDLLRKDIIDQVNVLQKENAQKPVETVSDLIVLMEKFEKENNQHHLFRFNELLIDIIQKIQAQAKKNQRFIDKAIHNLQTIREEASGQKSYQSYNAHGKSTRAKAPI